MNWNYPLSGQEGDILILKMEHDHFCKIRESTLHNLVKSVEKKTNMKVLAIPDIWDIKIINKSLSSWYNKEVICCI